MAKYSSKYSFILDLTEEEFKKQEFNAEMARHSVHGCPLCANEARERWNAFLVAWAYRWHAKQGKTYPENCPLWQKYFGS